MTMYEESGPVPSDDELSAEPLAGREEEPIGFISDEELREFVIAASALGFCRPSMAVKLRNVLHQVHESHLMYFYPGVDHELGRIYTFLYQEGRLSLDVLSEITSREPLSLRHQSCGPKTDQLINLLLSTYRSRPG
ncbi:MAG TPA: hypothetical protein VFJ84_00880 [Candidatus Saccharimonadales bacterium]|nr:hypothetical protein [Candidatus Saccharimonadales bacterium]